MRVITIKTEELFDHIKELGEVHDVGILFREDLRHLLNSLSNDRSDTKCPYCNANLKEYWHKLTPMLVSSLVEMKNKILGKRENKIHLRNDLNLTKTQYNNFQKLRFHGLIAHCKNEDGTRDSGNWLITRRGNEFLKGELSVPSRVKTFRNRVIDHDTKKIFIKEVIGTTPFSEEDFQYTVFGVK